MQVSTQIDVKGALRALDLAKIKPSDKKRALTLAGLKQVENITERTAKGVGLKGKFKRYSAGYAEFKRSRSLTDSANVNLFLTGKMMGDLGVVKATDKFAVVSFNRSAERKKAAANQKVRPFMGITDAEQKQIAEVFKRAVFK